MPASIADRLLQKYSRQIVFLRAQQQRRRLRFVFGAGVSKPIDFPTWAELVERIAKEVGGADLIKGKIATASLTAKVQYLYEHFIRAQLGSDNFKDNRFKKEEARARWNAVLSSCLYRGARPVSEHPYLEKMLSLIKDSKFLINYNFDDTIEKLIAASIPKADRSGKEPFETTWSLTAPVYEDVLTIYHPNGFIPSGRHDYSSDRIVFSDEAYANQIADEQPGVHSFLHHLLQNTCILFGLSLEDVGLRQHLRRLALMAPGLNHVLVAHYDPAKPYTEEQQTAVSTANFEVYNLLTIFLATEEIQALCDLLSESLPDFSDRAARLGIPIKYTFYITGGVSAGKTTAVENFGSCYTYDEWVENSPDVVSKPYTELSNEEKDSADEWIGQQFHLKNRAIRMCTEGINVTAKDVARVIFIHPYKPCDLEQVLVKQLS